MREILFRGKSQGDGTWKEGHLVEGPFDDFRIVKEKTYGWIDQADDLVYEDTVGQFTGMLDKNGKRIFEGDVVVFRESKYVVEWVEKYCRFSGRNEGVVFAGFSFDRCEAIGNIHDNPELLEVTPDE